MTYEIIGANVVRELHVSKGTPPKKISPLKKLFQKIIFLKLNQNSKKFTSCDQSKGFKSIKIRNKNVNKELKLSWISFVIH